MSAGRSSLDPVTGMQLGLPTKLVPRQIERRHRHPMELGHRADPDRDAGASKDSNLTIAAMADREKKEPAGRKVEYSVVKPDFFVLSGLQGLKKFYVRGQIRGNEVRVLTILYDQATEGTMAPVVMVMSSAFAPFGGDNAQTAAPPPRRKVEYCHRDRGRSDDGAILTDRAAVEACDFVVIAGLGPAERVATMRPTISRCCASTARAD